jgi:hypothetical protein
MKRSDCVTSPSYAIPASWPEPMSSHRPRMIASTVGDLDIISG